MKIVFVSPSRFFTLRVTPDCRTVGSEFGGVPAPFALVMLKPFASKLAFADPLGSDATVVKPTPKVVDQAIEIVSALARLALTVRPAMAKASPNLTLFFMLVCSPTGQRLSRRYNHRANGNQVPNDRST